jgi:hypothetical protein
MNFYYNGAWRMDWGLGNPNKTASLIACLMIAVWVIPIVWNRGFWPTLIAFTGLAWCLVQTYSRGGMLSFLAGIGVMLFWVPRPWPKARWIGVMASLWVLGSFVLYAKAQTRYGQGLFSEDQSINNRLIIWRHVPEMMAAAPWGWGFGKGGDSYTQWFQPTVQSLNYLNLVNSHFTWMVEGGWLASFLYLLAWFVVLLLCWPLPHARFKALPLSIWTAFGVGACFSHVEESLWLWILPLLSLSYVGWERLQVHRWPSLPELVLSAFASSGIVAAVVAIGFFHLSQPVHFSEGTVTIGKGPITTLILVDRQVLGSLYGHTFRRFLDQNRDELVAQTFILRESSSHLPTLGVGCLVASGRLTQEDQVVPKLNQSEQVILINPTGFPGETKLSNVSPGNTLVYFGEYSQAPSRSSWAALPGVHAIQIDGASDFVPTWPQAVLTPHKI